MNFRNSNFPDMSTTSTCNLVKFMTFLTIIQKLNNFEKNNLNIFNSLRNVQ